jgi:hypothetical protein
MIPILVKSGRDAEVRNHLRVIDGYLLISFRDKEKQSCLGKGKSEIGAALSCAEAATVIQDAFSGEWDTSDVSFNDFFRHNACSSSFISHLCSRH